MPEPEGVTQATAGAASPPAWPAGSRPGHGENAGDRIGPYRLLEVLGQGGFGTVWLAERREPFVQRAPVDRAGVHRRLCDPDAGGQYR